MQTATKKTPTEPKSAKSSEKSALPSKEMQDAIKDAFPTEESTLLIRYLWTSESVHRFRANWWRNDNICDSKFLHVSKKKNGKIKVEEK